MNDELTSCCGHENFTLHSNRFDSKAADMIQTFKRFEHFFLKRLKITALCLHTFYGYFPLARI